MFKQLQIVNIKNAEFPALDCLRLLMAIFFMVVHMCLFTEISGPKDLTIIWFCDLSVPFFYMSGGYFLYRKMMNLHTGDACANVRKRSFKMFGLWMLWIVLYIPLEIYNYFITGLSILDVLPEIVYDLFTSGSLGCSWPLWFIYSMAVVFLILSFFKLNRNNLLALWLFFLLLELSLYIIDRIDHGIDYDIYWLFNRMVLRILNGGLGITTGMLMYFYREYLRVFMIPLFLAVSIALFYCELPYSNLFGGTALFITGLTIRLRPHPFYRFIRNVSMWTFYIQMYVIYVVIWSIRLGCLPEYFPVNYLTVGSVVLSVAICLSLLQRARGFKWLGFLIS